MLQISWKFLGVGTNWCSRSLPSQTVLWFYEIVIAWWIWETCQPMLYPLQKRVIQIGSVVSCETSRTLGSLWETLPPWLSFLMSQLWWWEQAARAAPGLHWLEKWWLFALLISSKSVLHPLEFTINTAQGNAHSNESWELWRTNMQHFTHPAFLIWLLLSAFGVALISWDF